MNTPFPLDFVYDVETPINCFQLVMESVETNNRWIYECSARRDNSYDLAVMLQELQRAQARMVGFNIIHFDYPIIHEFLRLYKLGYRGEQMAFALWHKAQAIFGTSEHDKFAHRVWERDHFVKQVDLYLIHHFDNRNKSTSLKALEFNMRASTVVDMPIDPNAPLTFEQMDRCLAYCCNDVTETKRFYFRSMDMIKQRAELSARIPELDFTNFNDTKIGKQFFINELEKRAPGSCYERVNGKRTPRMTYRRQIALGEIILPYIQFQTPEFQRGLAFLKSTTITETKKPPELSGFNVTLRGFRFDIQAGGVHGSHKKIIVRADADHEIIDVDVASYYPNIAIQNGSYPAHLGVIFCEIYQELYLRRKTLDKKSSESAMLKLALNGVFGESNSAYPSPLVDPQYTMTTTFNGQLLLCMLAEAVQLHPGVEIIQINTDGLTAKVHRDAKEYFHACCKAWENFTRLELETVYYQAMFIRDVNNYLSLTVDGKIKRKGDYQHDTTQPNNPAVSKQWNQNWSALVVPKAVEAYLLHGRDLKEFIYAHDDPFDFMLRAKVPRSSRLQHDGAFLDGHLARYYVAKNSPPLFKIMPPLARKGPDAPPRQMAINKGWGARVCNDLRDWRTDLLDHDFYIAQAEKLIRLEELDND